MKYCIFIFLITCIVMLPSCSNEPITSTPSATGAVIITIRLNQVGKLWKNLTVDSIMLSCLRISLSSGSQYCTIDTFEMSGGYHEWMERIIYTGLTVNNDEKQLEWNLDVDAWDLCDSEYHNTIYSGDTLFTLSAGDTVEVPLILDAHYSMLIASIYPAKPDRLYELQIDDTICDQYKSTSHLYPIDPLVVLSSKYLTASHGGEMHHILLNVYDGLSTNVPLLYSGATDIITRSGEDTCYPVILTYMGKDSTDTLPEMFAQLGNTIKFAYSLTMYSNGNGTVSGSTMIKKGEHVVIKAKPDTDYYFAGWKVVSGTPSISNLTADSTTVVLYNGNAIVKGCFKLGKTFQTRFGNASNQKGCFIERTGDNEYIISGTTEIVSNDYYDPEIVIYFIKTDNNGNLLWHQTFEYDDWNTGHAITLTDDSSYIILTSTSLGINRRTVGILLLKVDENGNMLWIRTFGGVDYDIGYAIKRTSDGGYIIVGQKGSTSKNSNVYLIKTNEIGDTLWTRVYKDTIYTCGYSVEQTDDNGYIIAGYKSTCYLSSCPKFILMIKTDSLGNTLWDHTFSSGIAKYVRHVDDGGYIIIGTMGEGIGFIRTDEHGDTLFTRTINDNTCNSVRQTDDGGYIIAGKTSLHKIDKDGTVIWTRAFEEEGSQIVLASVQQIANGGYIITGSVSDVNYGFNTESGDNDVLLIKTDENGNVEKTN